MTTLNDYFRTEARDFLNALERSLQRTPAPDAAELHRAVRGLRGTAQMAREQRIFDVVSAFESVTRAIADGALAWSDGVAAGARDTIADLRVLLDPAEDEEQLDARVSDAAARWRNADPGSASVAAPPTADTETKEFREFAAREAAAIADALDHGVAELQTDPMNREPLSTILRRQRALLGSARLEEIPVIADILRAVEELTRVIVKLDVGVKQEWLDIYRVARDALQTTIAPLLRDELPQSSNSVSRLRHMRAELLERYGSAAEASPPAVDPLAASGSLPANMIGNIAPASAGTAQRTNDSPGDQPGAAATLPQDPQPRRSGSVPAAPFMGPARSTPRPHAGTSAGASAQTARPPVAGPAQTPPMSSAAPGAPPMVTGSNSPTGDVLELEESSVIDADTSTPEAEAGSGDADAYGETLELGDDAIVDEDAGMLELGDDSIVHEGEGMLELGEESVVDDEADTLELGEESVVVDEADTLELGEESVVDDEADTLDLGKDSIIDEDPSRPAHTDSAAAGDAGLGVAHAVEDIGLVERGDADVAANDTGGIALGDPDTAADAAGPRGLGDSAVADDDTAELQLLEGVADDDAQMLDLSSSSAADDDGSLLQLDDGGLDDDAEVIEFPEDDTTRQPDTAVTGRTYSREEALQRALELRDVVARAAAHDPAAREAVDELFTLLKTALE